MDLLVGGSTLSMFESTLQSQHCLFYEIPARTSSVAVKWAPECPFHNRCILFQWNSCATSKWTC